jgi:hypothetical protein
MPFEAERLRGNPTHYAADHRDRHERVWLKGSVNVRKLQDERHNPKDRSENHPAKRPDGFPVCQLWAAVKDDEKNTASHQNNEHDVVDHGDSFGRLRWRPPPFGDLLYSQTKDGAFLNRGRPGMTYPAASANRLSYRGSMKSPFGNFIDPPANGSNNSNWSGAVRLRAAPAL